MAVGDFDDDGNLDLGATSNFYYYGGYYYGGFYQGFANVLLGSDGGFSLNNTTAISSSFPMGALAVDVDGDNDDDLVTATGTGAP